MEYAKEGSLRKNLPILVKSGWKSKTDWLCYIINGINAIHQSNLVHSDLHDGNILKCDDIIKE